MADIRGRKRSFTDIGRYSSAPYGKARGRWWRGGHSRSSISAALAIPTAAPPMAPGASGAHAHAQQQSNVSATSSSTAFSSPKQQLPQQQPNFLQRQGRKRHRRHRHSSFSGPGGAGSSTLPAAVAAALAISPSTDDASRYENGGGSIRVSPKLSTAANNSLFVPGASGGQQTSARPQQTTSTVDAAESGANGDSPTKRKKRRSRRKRRTYKPYFKLTADERRELEAREEQRAERVRALRFAHGQPVAPYNTTQFLLQDRELRNGGEPDCGDLEEIVRNIRHHTRSGSYESAVPSSSGGECSSEFSDYSYLQREFNNDWLDEQRQHLETMSKDELVKELMDLQKQYEWAQQDMRTKRLAMEAEIADLRRENEELRQVQNTTDASIVTTSIISEETITTRQQRVADGPDNMEFSATFEEVNCACMDPKAN